MFQDIVLKLTKYWVKLGCNIVYPFNLEIGAATLHPITFFSSINKKRCFFCYIQLCKRPMDNNVVLDNLNVYKLQEYYQFQVIIKPSFNNIQNLYLDSLKCIGINFDNCDIRFVEDNWENPSLGAYGVGYEVCINGLEVTQFTYFQQMGNIHCSPVSVEIAYGLERLCLCIQNISSVFDITWNNSKFGILTYKNMFYESEKQKSLYNFYFSNKKFLYLCFQNHQKEALRLLKLKKPLFYQSYDFAVKTVNFFNLLNARNYFSNIERQNFILIIRNLFKKIANIYISFLNKQKS